MKIAPYPNKFDVVDDLSLLVSWPLSLPTLELLLGDYCSFAHAFSACTSASSSGVKSTEHRDHEWIPSVRGWHAMRGIDASGIQCKACHDITHNSPFLMLKRRRISCSNDSHTLHAPGDASLSAQNGMS